MNKIAKSILFWTPRILGILFILFVGMFSLDVFGTGAGFWVTLGGFFIHNIPTLILLATLLVGWRWEWVGAVGFLAVAVWFLGIFHAGDWLFLLIFIVIPALVGVLFLLGWVWRKKIRA